MRHSVASWRMDLLRRRRQGKTIFQHVRSIQNVFSKSIVLVTSYETKQAYLCCLIAGAVLLLDQQREVGEDTNCP